jgi:aconitate hydratase
VLVKSFARIHLQNLINYGVLPIVFEKAGDYDRIEQGDAIKLTGIRKALERGEGTTAKINGKDEIHFENHLTQRQREVLLAGGLINWCSTCGIDQYGNAKKIE